MSHHETEIDWDAVAALRHDADRQIAAISERIAELEVLLQEWRRYGYNSLAGKPTVRRPRPFVK